MLPNAVVCCMHRVVLEENAKSKVFDIFVEFFILMFTRLNERMKAWGRKLLLVFNARGGLVLRKRITNRAKGAEKPKGFQKK